MNTLLVATRFSGQAMSSMIIIALLCTAVPFIFLGYYRAKTGAKISSFFMGMVFYFLTVFIAEGALNYVMFGVLPLQSVLNRNTHPVMYAIYGAVIAGVFEEVGKYIGLRFCMKNRPGKQNAFLFGVGHGGFETIAYGSSLFMGNIVIALIVNNFGVDGYFEKLGIQGESVAEQKQLIYDLMAIPPIENVAAGTERLLALVLQASLAVLIYLSIQNEKKKILFPAAILLHIIGYLPTYLTQVGVIKSLALNLCLTGGIIVITASYAYREFHQLKE